MARTASEVITSLKANVKAADPSVDVNKGPVYDLTIQPVGSEVSNIEGQTETLSRLYSLEFAQVATADQVTALATNFSQTPGGGQKARCIQHFFRFSRPPSGETIVIPKGAIVGNFDNTLMYRILDEVVMSGQHADQYYNPAKKTYEIATRVEAVSSGLEYDIPEFRITRMVTPVTGIDGTENRQPAIGGTSPEDQAETVTRIQKKFQGIDQGTQGGIASTVHDYAPEYISDVSVVEPTQRVIFRRDVVGPALDIIVIGNNYTADQMIYTAIGNEGDQPVILIEKRPVFSVESVLKNGVSVDFDFLFDTSDKLGRSPFSSDSIMLKSALVQNDVVTINYTYNKLINDLQNDKFSDKKIFGTDMVAREAIPTKIAVQIDVKAVPSADSFRTQSAVEGAVSSLIETNTFIESLVPDEFRRELIQSVPGIVNIFIKRFNRSVDAMLDIEVIEFEANEYPVVDTELLIINVVK